MSLGERTDIHVSADRDHFSNDGDGDFFRSDGSDFQTHRRIDAFKLGGRNAFPFQFLVNGEHLSLGTNHSYVPGRLIDSPSQDTHIVTMSACNDDDVSILWQLEFRESGVEVFGYDFARFWEAFA